MLICIIPPLPDPSEIEAIAELRCKGVEVGGVARSWKQRRLYHLRLGGVILALLDPRRGNFDEFESGAELREINQIALIQADQNHCVEDLEFSGIQCEA
jgi:hypothetical protein